MTTRLHNYAEVRAYLEKKHPDWLRALTPRHINAPADYWPQKVLAVSSVNAAMENYVSIYENRTLPNPALAAVHGQAALLLRYDVPTYYVPQELLAAAARTELPDEMVFERFRFHSTPWSELTSSLVENDDLDPPIHSRRRLANSTINSGHSGPHVWVKTWSRTSVAKATTLSRARRRLFLAAGGVSME